MKTVEVLRPVVTQPPATSFVVELTPEEVKLFQAFVGLTNTRALDEMGLVGLNNHDLYDDLTDLLVDHKIIPYTTAKAALRIGY